MDKPIPEFVVEAVARAICVACEENPDHQGDARGNEFRWQDYRAPALAAISTLATTQQQGQPAAVDEATRLLRAYRGAPKFSNDHNAIKQTCALEDEIDLFLATQQ